MTVTSPNTAKPTVSFLENTLDRQSARRKDYAYIEALLQKPDTRIVLTTGESFVFQKDTDHEIGHKLSAANHLGAETKEFIFLGHCPLSKSALFACCLPHTDQDFEPQTHLFLRNLRSLAFESAFSPDRLSILAQAQALVQWHGKHRFCSNCGTASVMAEAGYRRDCPACGSQHFPRIDPCVSMLITDGERILLGRPVNRSYPIFATLAGFMEPGETIEQAVRRETLEEAGVLVGDVRIMANQPWPFPANLMIGCIGQALSSDIHIARDELESCRWFGREEVSLMVEGRHHDGYSLPPEISISFQLIKGWLDSGGDSVGVYSGRTEP